MQQCMKSDISSTQDNRAVVPALHGHGAGCDAWVCGRCRSRGTRWSGGGMTRMLSVIVAATLVMLAAVWVGGAFSFSGVSVDASGIVSLF